MKEHATASEHQDHSKTKVFQYHLKNKELQHHLPHFQVIFRYSCTSTHQKECTRIYFFFFPKFPSHNISLSSCKDLSCMFPDPAVCYPFYKVGCCCLHQYICNCSPILLSKVLHDSVWHKMHS